MTSDSDIATVKKRLQAEAAERRAAVGPSHFAGALERVEAQFPPQKAPTAATVAAQSGVADLKRALTRVPLVGYVAKLALSVARLPTRLGQLYGETAELRRRADHLEDKSGKISEMERSMASLLHDFGKMHRHVEGLLTENHRLKLNNETLAGHLTRLGDEVQGLRSEWGVTLDKLSAGIGSSSGPAATADEAPAFLDDFYYRFEERFRGSPATITERLQTYVPYLDTLKQSVPNSLLLDVGCGRGEWLKLVKSRGVQPKGIDLNARMIRECQAAGLDVQLGDATAYLRDQKTGSLGAVTGFHIVEHLPFLSLFRLFQEAYRALAPGGFVLFETPNPENIMVGACNFYTDPTHRNPIPPPALGFLLEQAGFRRQDCVRLSAIPLAKRPAEPEVAAVVERFHVGTDYAIIGFKDAIDL